jgi:hypothetical protein
MEVAMTNEIKATMIVDTKCGKLPNGQAVIRFIGQGGEAVTLTMLPGLAAILGAELTMEFGPRPE